VSFDETYVGTRRQLRGVAESLIAGPQFEKVLASDVARMFKAAGGVPAYGNIRSGWDVGCRYDFANAEHRAAIPSR
jgi:hypothetical protein